MTCGLSPKCSSKVYWRLPGAGACRPGGCRFVSRAAAATAAAVVLAEGLVRLGLRTSKVGAYAPPRTKNITGWPITSGPSSTN